MASREARADAIKRASAQVQAGSPFVRRAPAPIPATEDLKARVAQTGRTYQRALEYAREAQQTLRNAEEAHQAAWEALQDRVARG